MVCSVTVLMLSAPGRATCGFLRIEAPGWYKLAMLGFLSANPVMLWGLGPFITSPGREIELDDMGEGFANLGHGSPRNNLHTLGLAHITLEASRLG